jgi:ADP-ribosylglycohydrolase
VPEAIICFLESNDYEDAIRNAISLGGDSDTLACITGEIAAAFYGTIPEEIIGQTMNRLTPDMIEVLSKFEKNFKV